MPKRIILTAGSHEPIFHRIRTGNAAAHEWHRWHQETAPENLDLLQQLGINGVHVACTKGFGLEAEKPVIERAARLREQCARRDIRLSIYIQGLPVYYETFFLERPEAETWLALTQSAQPMPWNGQTFRRWMDPHSQAFLDYQRALIDYALRTVQPDAVSLDNTVMPGVSYTQRAVQSFRRFLQHKFDAKDLLHTFGIPSLDAVDLPRFDLTYWPPDAFRIVKDPLLQELAFWRAHTYTVWVNQIRQVVKQACPQAAFATTCGCDGLRYNHLFNTGINFETAIPAADNVHMEESGWRPRIFLENPTPAHQNLRVSTDARWDKIIANFGQKRGFSFWGEFDQTSQQIAAAHGLTFAAQANDFGTVGPLLASPTMLQHLAPVAAWAEPHADLLENRQRVAEIAVWRSTATCGFIRHTPVWAACAVEQMLFEHHLPFTILLDAALPDFLTAPRALILPMTSCISDEQADLISRFVRDGGGLLLLGDAGTRDERTRVRPQHAFGALLPPDCLQAIERIGPPHFVPEPDITRLTHPIRHTAGKGRLCLVPQITPRAELDLTRDPYTPWRQVAPKDVQPPANETEILAELKWVLADRNILSAEAPRHTLCEFWRQHADLLICAANLHPSLDGGPVVLHTPGIDRATAQLFLLFEDAPRPLDIVAETSTIPQLPRFAAIKIPHAFANNPPLPTPAPTATNPTMPPADPHADRPDRK